ncbi:MAG TPA: kelch repeat-containing protein [Myxococcota bacterium]|nr:kelch repeat-containing protein [Myxococcota bacterium]
MRFARSPLLAGLIMLAACGCGEVKHVPGKQCAIDLRIHTPPDQDTWEGVASLRVTIEIPGTESLVSIVDVSSAELVLGGSPASSVVLTIEGLGLDGQTVISSGRSPPFELSEGDPAELEVLFARKGEFTKLGDLGHARFAHAAAALPDGRVLFFGGASEGERGSPKNFRPPEIYDPALQTSCAADDAGCPDFPEADRRVGHTLTATPQGRVLVFGGENEQGSLVEPILLFDPATSTFRELGNYDPADVESRTKHAAVLFSLRDGAEGRDTILVAGGEIGPNGQRSLTASALLFDVLAETFTRTDLSLVHPRHDFSLTSFGPGRHDVLAAGGLSANGLLDSCELFDGTVFSNITPSGEHARGGLLTPRIDHVAIGTDDGVLIIGGDNSFQSIDAPEIYLADAEAGSGFFVLDTGEEPAGHEARRGLVAARLPNADILYAAGEAYDGFEDTLLSSAELAHIDQEALSASFSATNALGRQIAFASVSLLTTGGLLIAGGFVNSADGPCASAEVWYYNP